MEAKDKKRIWWLASYPKSGSTWVRMFVNAYVTGFPLDINSAWQYVSGDLQPQWYQLTAAAPITRMDDVDCFYYRPAVLLNHVYTSHSRDCVLKTHHAKTELDGIPLIPPRLSKGALYIIRDPMDVLVSFADHMGVTLDRAIELMASNNSSINKDDYKLFHVLMSWSSHVKSWTTSNKDVRTEVVRYEDLHNDPQKHFRAVISALGLPYISDDRFEFALEQASFASLRKAETDKGFREKGAGDSFFRNGKSGSWRTVLTADQISIMEQNHREVMRRWGYETSAPVSKRRVFVKASGVVL